MECTSEPQLVESMASQFRSTACSPGPSGLPVSAPPRKAGLVLSTEETIRECLTPADHYLLRAGETMQHHFLRPSNIGL
ncbi:hypothetical protein DPMN_065238 [Dreissena polymorpha]|uniref:Uncharacterized protein n=1 Tax=Dreissena polymorpha TaxID=45954 RepID=A0A9D4HKX1_DREPO|nr:hypothetical protein DPMN_065238 [Dreissena polymorpha]